MNLEEIKECLKREKEAISKARALREEMINHPDRKEICKAGIISQLRQINILNKSIKNLELGKKNKTLQSKNINLTKEDKEKYLKELRIGEEILSSIKNKKEKEQKKTKPSKFARISNKIFGKVSEKLSREFSSLGEDLKKGNIPFILSTYISMMLFSISISLVAGIIIFLALIITDLSNAVHFWIIFLLPIITFAIFYFYPSSEASSLKKRINLELPFAAIHMAAIAGSDMEPTQIFKVIIKSGEYPSLSSELRKIVSQVELYGYDLVTSLRNIARTTPNEKLAELLEGLATNISTGGELKNFLEKKSENFLLDYKLERKNYARLAGTLMDIYISILIAAPLILVMTLVIMGQSGLGIGGISIADLMSISIMALIIVNILFLILLKIKQPPV